MRRVDATEGREIVRRNVLGSGTLEIAQDLMVARNTAERRIGDRRLDQISLFHLLAINRKSAKPTSQ